MTRYSIWARKGFEAQFDLDLKITAITLLNADHWDWRLAPASPLPFIELEVRSISLGWQKTNIRGSSRSEIFRHVVANAILVGAVTEQ